MKSILGLAHGILSTDETWVDPFTSWLANRMPETICVHAKYFALPLPLFTNLIEDPIVVRDHVRDILMLKHRPGYDDAPIYLVGHSNGGCIVLRDAFLLAKAGHPVAGMVLVDAAVDDDVANSGIEWLVETNRLGFAASYSSHGDDVLGQCPGEARTPWQWLKDSIQGRLMWPWGHLGSEGFTKSDVPYQSPDGRIFTRWHSGGHSACFSLHNRNKTFREIMADLTTVFTVKEKC
jgi:pimeloyl-ACP methyl ester carboxylesterase